MVLVWNVVYNVGGGLIGLLFLFGLVLFGDWCLVFYVLVIVVVGVVVFVYFVMCDIL